MELTKVLRPSTGDSQLSQSEEQTAGSILPAQARTLSPILSCVVQLVKTPIQAISSKLNSSHESREL
jgi:hypothetical protein